MVTVDVKKLAFGASQDKINEWEKLAQAQSTNTKPVLTKGGTVIPMPEDVVKKSIVKDPIFTTRPTQKTMVTGSEKSEDKEFQETPAKSNSKILIIVGLLVVAVVVFMVVRKMRKNAKKG